MRKGMKKEIVVIFLFALMAYPVIVVAAYCTQSYAIFQSRGASLRPPRHLDIDEISLTTPDGERLHAWWLQTTGATKTVLFFQPNGTNISYHANRVNTFEKMGVNALLVDYRGYGLSSGRIKEEQHIYTDGRTAWNYLVHAKGIAPETIVIWGRSLGGAVAAEIAQHQPIAALVLESTFHSLHSVASRQYWYLPTARLLRFHFENGRKLNHVRAPVVIIHSADDNYIPFRHARLLYDAASGPRTMIATTGAHTDSFDDPQTLFGSPARRSSRRKDVRAALMQSLGLEAATNPSIRKEATHAAHHPS